MEQKLNSNTAEIHTILNNTREQNTDVKPASLSGLQLST
jgi:hypothetical protein